MADIKKVRFGRDRERRQLRKEKWWLKWALVGRGIEPRFFLNRGRKATNQELGL